MSMTRKSKTTRTDGFSQQLIGYFAQTPSGIRQQCTNAKENANEGDDPPAPPELEAKRRFRLVGIRVGTHLE